MRPRSILGCGLLLCLLLPLPGFADQSFRIAFEGWTDYNGNGMIDCSEPVTFRINLSQDAAPSGPETGTITVPFNSSVRWLFTPGSVAPDPIFNDGCTFTLVQGNFPNDTSAVLGYSCDPHARDPLDNSYSRELQ